MNKDLSSSVFADRVTDLDITSLLRIRYGSHSSIRGLDLCAALNKRKLV